MCTECVRAASGRLPVWPSEWLRGRKLCRPLEGEDKAMIFLAHTRTTRLVAYMAAALSAAGTLPRLARTDSSTRAHTLHSDRADQFIFRPLPDEPAARATNPEPNWLQLAAHYRPVA